MIKYCNWILCLVKYLKNVIKCVFKDRSYKSWRFENSLRRNEMLMYPLWSVFIPISFPGVWLRFYECRDRLWSALGVLSLRELFNEWDFELTNWKTEKKKKIRKRIEKRWARVHVCERKREQNMFCVNIRKKDDFAMHAWYLRGKKERGREIRDPLYV